MAPVCTVKLHCVKRLCLKQVQLNVKTVLNCAESLCPLSSFVWWEGGQAAFAVQATPPP